MKANDLIIKRTDMENILEQMELFIEGIENKTNKTDLVLKNGRMGLSIKENTE